MFDLPASNVVSLDNTRNLAEADTGIFFPVKEVALKDLTGKPDNGLKAVVRTDTDELLAVNGRRYKLVTNQSAYKVVDDAIKKAHGLKTDGMYIRDRTAYRGGTTVREYIFPEHNVEVAEGDVTEMRITVVNSYDGSSGFKMMVGGFRLICLNGMVAGKTLDRYKARHTSGLSLDSMALRLHNGVHSFTAMGDKWKAWLDTELTDEQALAYINKLAISEPMKAQVESYWYREALTLGRNKWALYNALTYYSTHHRISRGAGNEAAIVLNREADVSRVVTQLEAA